jgi:Methyltransferase domain
MATIEVKTALRHLPELARHPGWLPAYLQSGRPGLFRQLVEDSLQEVASSPGPASLASLASFRPLSAVGRMGGTQEYLYHLIRIVHPTTVVETGVFRGISSAFILAALEANGHGQLSSIDLPRARYTAPGREPDRSPLPPGEETGFVVPAALRTRWSLTLGDSKRELVPLLERLGTVDLFIHDSEHTYEFMKWEYAVALPHLRDGGILASDDTDWNAAFSELVSSGPIPWSTTIHGKLGVALVDRRVQSSPNPSVSASESSLGSGSARTGST